MHGLAGTVDAALGPGVEIERARRRTPGYAAVGQVEAGTLQVEEDEIESTPGTRPAAPSMRAVTSRSMVSGAAPG